MVAMVTDFRVSVLLAVQGALWDLETPNLRGVAILAGQFYPGTLP